jgi:hypothetical protein
MIYIVKAFDKKQRRYIPYIISFIKSIDPEEPVVTNYIFKSEYFDYENVDFGTMKNMTKEKEEEYERDLIKSMENQTEDKDD